LKLITYSENKTSPKTHAGVLWGEWVLDVGELGEQAKKLEVKVPQALRKLREDLPTILEVLEEGPRLLDDVKNVSWRLFNRMKPRNQSSLKKLKSVTIQAPIPRPPTIRDFYAFEDHVKAAREKRGLQMVPEWYEFPAFYYSNPNAIYGPGETVPIPAYTKMLDFELEVACIIGKAGKDIPEKEAEAYIAGYTIMNDWSAREVQQKEMKIGLGPAKAKDFATSIGPWLVTRDELEDRLVAPGKFRLQMTARVNGKQISSANMDRMHWSFPQMIARASQSVELRPGEVLGSGTAGTGCILELGTGVQPWLEPGDVVDLEIERLGKLTNKVIRP
jgi:2-keto-4-pentenoate hydratase/2-oxohepta-3-ene-1,7-dioic acid hydratase in catechol pathway